MALVKYGGGIAQMSGKLGGNVYARNSGGNYVRTFTSPINPNTDRQVLVRAVLAFLTTRWSDTLTEVQRTAWNLYAASVTVLNRLGESIHISGFNHYIRSNAFLKRWNLTLIDNGPVIFELPAHDPTFAITASEATQLISVTFDNTMDWADETGGYLELYQGSPQNAQRNFFAGPWRHISGIPGVDGVPPASPFDAPVEFAIAEGQRQWMYGRIRRADGRLSEPFRDDVLVGA